MTPMTSSPRIAIGMPVYNGEAYLAEAIKLILAQTFQDFEVIIFDNASTDRTAEIYRSYASQDQRIHYYRNERNLGAAVNYNRCFAASSSVYFKWFAHDDVILPNFLHKCVKVLDTEPDIVLCHSVVEHVDEQGKHLAYYDPGTLGTWKTRPSERLHGRLSTAWCKEVFGLIRSDVLRGSVMTAAYVGSDQTLLAELALRGRFAILREPLFKNRDHGTRSTRFHNYSQARLAWYDTSGTRRLVLPRWIMTRTITSLITKWIHDPHERMRCYLQLARMLIVGGRIIPLALEPLFATFPQTFMHYEGIKKALGFGKNRHLRLRDRPDGA